MILSINRTKTITPKSLGNDKAIPSTVTYRVPTARGCGEVRDDGEGP